MVTTEVSPLEGIDLEGAPPCGVRDVASRRTVPTRSDLSRMIPCPRTSVCRVSTRCPQCGHCAVVFTCAFHRQRMDEVATRCGFCLGPRGTTGEC
jgi:hypothetical protein